MVNVRKVFETGLSGKGVWNCLFCARCLEVVSLGKAFETGQFA
jgi:hypothetical protein